MVKEKHVKKQKEVFFLDALTKDALVHFASV